MNHRSTPILYVYIRVSLTSGCPVRPSSSGVHVLLSPTNSTSIVTLLASLFSVGCKHDRDVFFQISQTECGMLQSQQRITYSILVGQYKHILVQLGSQKRTWVNVPRRGKNMHRNTSFPKKISFMPRDRTTVYLC